MSEAPHRTDKPLEQIILTGTLMPVSGNEQPCWLVMPGSDGLYLPLFRKAVDAKAILARAGMSYTKLKIITDGHAFLDSIPFFLWHDPPPHHPRPPFH